MDKGFTQYINFAMRQSRNSRAARSCITGFTLIELVVVIAIIAVLAGLTAPSLVSHYNYYKISGERDLLGSLVRRARGMSLAGANGKDHGLKIASASYTIFEGTSWATRDTTKDLATPRNTSITMTGGSEIVFSYLSGRSSTATLVLSDTINTASISINQEGLISW